MQPLIVHDLQVPGEPGVIRPQLHYLIFWAAADEAVCPAIRRMLAHVDPRARKLSPPEGDDSSLWCNKLWGLVGKGLAAFPTKICKLCGREAPNLRPLAGLVSVYGVANHRST
jgi:hypothetical protein